MFNKTVVEGMYGKNVSGNDENENGSVAICVILKSPLREIAFAPLRLFNILIHTLW